MVVQRSSDWGQTWKPYRYFAEDCSQFPNIELGPIPSTIDEVICDDSYNKKVPSTKGEIVLKVLEPQLHKDLPDPYAPEVIFYKQFEEKPSKKAGVKILNFVPINTAIKFSD